MPVFYHSMNEKQYNTIDKNTCEGYKEMFQNCLSKKINSNNYEGLIQSYNLCGDIETKYYQCLRR